MNDLSTNEFPSLSELKLTDKVTLTDSATDQQFASMEVAKFVEELNKVQPSVTLRQNGLMSYQYAIMLTQLSKIYGRSGGESDVWFKILTIIGGRHYYPVKIEIIYGYYYAEKSVLHVNVNYWMSDKCITAFYIHGNSNKNFIGYVDDGNKIDFYLHLRPGDSALVSLFGDYNDVKNATDPGAILEAPTGITYISPVSTFSNFSTYSESANKELDIEGVTPPPQIACHLLKYSHLRNIFQYQLTKKSKNCLRTKQQILFPKPEKRYTKCNLLGRDPPR